MRKFHRVAAVLLLFLLPQISSAQTGTGNLYVYRPTDSAVAINGQAMTCTSSCSGSTVMASCNYTFDPLGKSCTGAGYFTGHTDFSSLQGCITQETTTSRALSSGEQNLASCDICDSGACIACNGNLQATNAGVGYNQCETQCGAPVGTSPAGVTYTCDDQNVGVTIPVCDATGTTYFADRCGNAGTSCALADNTSLCRTSAYATGCTASTGCNNVPPGTNINACANTGQAYLRDRCDNACAIQDLNVCGAPSFGAGCTGDESCNGVTPGVQTLSCNHVGNTYFQDSCDNTCKGGDNISICRSAGSLNPLDGCTANTNCNNVAPNTCAGATKCNADCSYSTCDNGCCNSTKTPPYAEGFCSGTCIGNNMPTATNFKGGGTYIPTSSIKLNATLQDNDERNELVTITFYQNSACSLTLTSGSCTPIGAGTCAVNASLTLGSVPDAYLVYYKATDSRLTSPCTSTTQTITIHNFTLSFDYQDKPMLVNATGWIYLTATSQPERMIMDNTQIASNSYTIKKGATTIKSGILGWEPSTNKWTANITPPSIGYYDTLATFTDTYGLTNSITAQMEAADTLSVGIDTGALIEIPIGQSALVHLNVQNTGNKMRTYNLTFLGDTYTTSFNGQDISGRRWQTLMDVPASSNRTGLILIAGQEVSPNIKEFKVNVRNTQTNAESETKTIQYRVVYTAGNQKVAPDLDTLSLMLLLSSGILYVRFSSCKQKNSRK